jgi:hypothetical protein
MSGQSFPIVDAIVGATLVVAALHLILDGEGQHLTLEAACSRRLG